MTLSSKKKKKKIASISVILLARGLEEKQSQNGEVINPYGKVCRGAQSPT